MRSDQTVMGHAEAKETVPMHLVLQCDSTGSRLLKSSTGERLQTRNIDGDMR